MPSRRQDVVVGAVAAAALAVGAIEARRGALRPVESRCFDAINGISGRAAAPVWGIMQLGSLGGALATGAVVVAAGHRRTGRRLAAVGSLAWLGSKAVKPFARRGRPASVVERSRILGREQSGLGYPSGHAAVAAAMAAAVAPRLRPPLRPVVFAVAAGIGAARVYVGAHLPLDVAGGAALGIAVERGGRVLAPDARPPAGRR